MMAGEMMTARRLGLNVVFVVLADRGLSLIHVKQERSGYEHYGARLSDGDLFASEHLFGVPVFTAADASAMHKALKRAFSAEGPCIIEAVIDGAEYRELVATSYR
jgi:acetolactate synthase-1/2/3 large subunit